MRCTIANNKPILVTFLSCSSGSLFAAIEIKTILSIPSVISIKVSFYNANVASNVKSKSNITI